MASIDSLGIPNKKSPVLCVSRWDQKYMSATCIPTLNTQVSLGCAAHLVSPLNYLFFQNEALSPSDS